MIKDSHNFLKNQHCAWFSHHWFVEDFVNFCSSQWIIGKVFKPKFIVNIDIKLESVFPLEVAGAAKLDGQGGHLPAQVFEKHQQST